MQKELILLCSIYIVVGDSDKLTIFNNYGKSMHYFGFANCIIDHRSGIAISPNGDIYVYNCNKKVQVFCCL